MIEVTDDMVEEACMVAHLAPDGWWENICMSAVEKPDVWMALPTPPKALDAGTV